MEIKIAVACHKPSKLPKNNLFLPVQVGAALAKKKLPIQPDNEGENISEKNPQYCELTAQYWLWKNANADYYGLCHYRRFLCFHGPTDAKHNLRKQIEASVIDDFNIKRFGLNNEDEMRQIIESHDVIVGELQEIRKVPTPRGNKKTALKHWLAHDRALIKEHDLYLMLQILDKVAPAVGADAREYLNGGHFLGFNCFVMKKALFDEMCRIEFSVLEQLEQEIDLATYGQQLSRIYGFMGEIISSAYFYHLEKSGKYKIKHVPLLYFNYTDSIEVPRLAGKSVKKPIVPVLFDFSDTQAYFFGTTWQSFLDYVDSSCQYDILLLSDANSELRRAFSEMAADYKNVSLRFLDAKMYWDIIHKRYYHSQDSLKRIQDPLRPNNKLLFVAPFLPIFLEEYKKILVFGKNTLFGESIMPFWESGQKSKKTIAAAYDLLSQGQINDIFAERLENQLSSSMSDPLNFLLTDAMFWDLAKFRKIANGQEIAEASKDHKKGIRPKSITINVLCQNDKEHLSQKWGVWYESNDYLAYQLAFAPLETLNDTRAARKNPGIITYMEDDPWLLDYTEIYTRFWSIARRTPMYEVLLQHYSELTHRQLKSKKAVVDRVAPVGYPLRNVIAKIAPQGSRRHDAARSILDKFNLR